jgi:DNA-binding MarR family transcriptional regulator
MATADDDLLALEAQLCFALAQGARRGIGLYRPLLEPLGINHPQYLVLLALWQQDGPTLAELAATLDVDPGNLSTMLRRLEELGYLTRARRDDDARALRVQLTDAGRTLRERARLIPPAIVDRVGMPPTELAELRDALHRFIAATRT